MKNYGKYYTFSELNSLSVETLIDIISDGDMPNQIRGLAELVLDTKEDIWQSTN